MDEKYQKAKAKYEEVVAKSIAKVPERKSPFMSTSGYEIKRVYTPEDIQDLDYVEDLGFPGDYPYTRGVQPTMYRARFWTMRQYAGFGTAEESNKRYKYLLQQGQTGLSVAFDLPTQIGYDSDDPMAEGEVGRVGVAIDSLEDMEILFDGIPLDQVSTSMTINSTAMILLAMYIAVAEKQGVSQDKLSGTIQNDILKEYIARGTYIYPPEPSMRLITDIFEYCSKYMPKWNPISISGYHIREAGSTAVQEVAFTLADGIAYVEAAMKKGLDPNVFGKRLSFFFAAHNNFLEEIAKFRAARRLWAKIMKNRFGVTDPDAMKLRFHTQTGGSTLTAQQPLNNIIRVTIQALAAVLGGTQSLHTNSYDEALGLPTEESARIALRTQQIIAYESGVADTIDPFGGSYVVEAMTNEIEKRAMEYIEKIDQMGGMIKAIESGYVQKEIHESAYKHQLAVEKGEEIIVGVNKFQIEEDLKQTQILKVDPELEKKQKERLKKLKERRDNEKVKKLLNKIKEVATTDENLFPYVLEAVKAYATVGEISNALREVFGEYTETVII
ncbi:methylmalonyl-CoA mutase, N-terminal domain/subunit [Fervidobacterium pennivorans DSM 9078]|jgi:methylmalonyl-CoA mutase N-terminal domain/subunit|uniref:methylmalonyl-CoA mutase n=1 Tax=Fervidobacterium pennivorans (strain DSM 9078 / Ven5) TaxID=771875 RepID=H9UEX9_FERPD|nr:methylmalonyl-CoA mutase family protein [Fervidobacterium pennivorans]AFG36072.1 methylmalonyl-CoA mutase, N-terminal domain/subunit [Fervidobacterium pennivorans DSM 9078]QIV79116.1 methylmalonyl-CoA mutase family protein [Fervidobacterium pennivorans subsp. keratinolyticus]